MADIYEDIGSIMGELEADEMIIESMILKVFLKRNWV